MAELPGELELYNQWFATADLDRDGVLSGGEAVQFFLRSGLPQNPTLFKVWQYVAGDRPALSRQEFYTAMKLVSLAQLNNGHLDDTQALRLVNGLTGPVPLPRMAGMTIPRSIEIPAHLLPRELTAGQAPGSQPAAAASPARAAAPPPAASPPPATAFPPLAAEQAAAFQTAFSQLDTDRDGYVMGTDCFAAFMQSGLPKASLKQIWDVVAGDEPRLSRHQFVQALYLIDCVKRGMPVPAALPPGPFPPVMGSANIATLSAGAPTDIYSATLVVPPMPPRQAYTPQPQPPMPFASQVPGLPADRVSALEAAERTRLETEREAALAREAEQRKAEEERAAAAARREFFTRSLADLRLTQSKVNRALVEAQQRCEMEKAAAEQMEADYNRAYSEFSVAHAQHTPLVEALKRAQEDKAALAQRLESLRSMVQQLEDFDPEWETREKGECEALNLEIAELTVKKERLQAQAAAQQSRRVTLQTQIAGLKQAAEGAEAQLAALTEQVDKVAEEGGKDKDAVVELLKQVAPLYNKLYGAAKAAMVPLPAEAVATIKREASPFQYDALLGAAASDWGSFKDEGFKIVSALPVDTRLTTFAGPSVAALEKAEAAGSPATGAAAPAAEGSPLPLTDAAATAPVPAAAATSPGAGVTAIAGGSPQAAGADAKPLERPASNAEAEAVSAAAEAGVLASAIAEALSSASSPRQPGSKPSSRPASKQGSLTAAGTAAAASVAERDEAGGASPLAGREIAPHTADAAALDAGGGANPFEVSFDGGEEGAGEGASPVSSPPASADAFAAFDAATPAPIGQASPPVDQASRAFGSSVALVTESPKAAAGAGAEMQNGAAAAADGDKGSAGWTAF